MEPKKKVKKVDDQPKKEKKKVVASKKTKKDAVPSSENNEVEVTPEVMLAEQNEISVPLNDQLKEQSNESPDDSSEFVAQENNGVEEKQDEVVNATQENISVPEDSAGDENNHLPNEPGDSLIEVPEIVSTEDNDLMSETSDALSEPQEIVSEESTELKSQDDEVPAVSELISSETIPPGDATEDKTPREEKDNATYLNSQVDKLIKLIDEKNFVDFWFYVKELNKMIFTLRGLHKEERMKFKERIGELCEDAKKTQDELKAKVAKTSHLKLDRIQQIIDEALGFGTSHEEMEKSFHKIEEANKFLREGMVKGEDGEESADMSREHREKAKEVIKTAKDKIFDRKREIREGNFKKVTQRLTSISDSLMSQGRPQKVFDGIKSLRNEMRLMNLDRSQLREIDNVIETIWKKAREKANTGREYESKKRITDMQDMARRKAAFVQTLEKEIKELNAKWSSNVKNDFFKNRVNEWIEEKKQKIEETRKEMQSIEEKVKFLTEQMNRT